MAMVGKETFHARNEPRAMKGRLIQLSRQPLLVDERPELMDLYAVCAAKLDMEPADCLGLPNRRDG
jgi:hypothetical protein